MLGTSTTKASVSTLATLNLCLLVFVIFDSIINFLKCGAVETTPLLIIGETGIDYQSLTVGYAALYDYRFPNGADQFDQNWLPFLSHLLAFLNYTFQEKIIETNVRQICAVKLFPHRS